MPLHTKIFTVEFKLKVIKWYHNHGDSKHARHFQIDKKYIREWIQKDEF